jgi:hypothetical protein
MLDPSARFLDLPGRSFLDFLVFDPAIGGAGQVGPLALPSPSSMSIEAVAMAIEAVAMANEVVAMANAVASMGSEAASMANEAVAMASEAVAHTRDKGGAPGWGRCRAGDEDRESKRDRRKPCICHSGHPGSTFDSWCNPVRRAGGVPRRASCQP